jgi:hypothetical protein
MTTTTPIATTLAHLAPVEFFAVGVPSATKTMDLGRDRMTVVMYSQNFIPVQENSGFAKSIDQLVWSMPQRWSNSRGGTMEYRMTNTPRNPASWVSRAIAAHLTLVAIFLST